MKIITFDDMQESLQSHEMGTPMAKTVRQVGVCGSAVIKAIQKMESTDQGS